VLLNLNPDQRAAANSIEGSHVVIAGPGSGKTAMMIQRYLEMITTHRISAKDILNLTFTNSAASEMVSRVGMLDVDKVFRTFHAFALDLLQRERAHLPFQLCDTIIPVRGEKFQLLKDLMKMYPPITTFRSLSDKIEEWQSGNIDPERAMQESYNLKGTEYFYAAAYKDYEKKSREQGWLDFHGLMKEAVKLLETNDEVRIRNQRKYIAVDECQDTDVVQFRLLQLIYGGNIFVVGDENQCQPPGTLVDVLLSPKKGRVESQVEQVLIEELSETNDKLVSWDRRGKRVRLGSGRSFRRAVRQFDGNLLEIESNRKTTKVTPNHFVWVKFNREALKKKTHFVYLMWRRNLGFRIGTSSLKTGSGSNQISHRGYQEKADKMWVLEITDSGTEARTREEILSLQYQIPERVYESDVLSKEQTWRVFHSVSERGGFEILKNKGLLFNSPLVSWSRKREKHLTKFHGYFKTAAANIIEGLMDLPTKQSYKSAIINKIRKIEYHGPVYSLEVEKDHTYIADGIPVSNCIYEWRSAQSGNLSSFGRVFPGARTLYLGQNYRSTRKLVEFFKKIIPVDNGLASHMVSMREEGVDPTFTKFGDDIEEASVVLKCITHPEHSAVIARTNRQLMTFQKKCMNSGIKSKVLGRKNVWEQNEVRELLDLTKEKSDDFRPAHIVMTELMERNNLINKYRNTGSPNEKNPVENLNDIIKLAGKRGTVPEFLTWLRKLTWGAKSDKKPALSLTTVHQAKGREWKHVFVIGAQQGLMPHKDGELLEEHRILFVACTRAADTLDISFVGNLSQFLNDFKEEVEIYGEQID
jgi:superfamily I DNA/RNA helicase